MCPLGHGSQDQYWSRPVRKQAAQQKVSLNVMPLNHPETIPTPSRSAEKLSSTKPVPGAKKVEDCCIRPWQLPGVPNSHDTALRKPGPAWPPCSWVPPGGFPRGMAAPPGPTPPWLLRRDQW